MRVHALFCLVLFIGLIVCFEGRFGVRESATGIIFGPNGVSRIRVPVEKKQTVHAVVIWNNVDIQFSIQSSFV
jgi:hypothetical protein